MGPPGDDGGVRHTSGNAAATFPSPGLHPIAFPFAWTFLLNLIPLKAGAGGAGDRVAVGEHPLAHAGVSSRWSIATARSPGTELVKQMARFPGA